VLNGPRIHWPGDLLIDLRCRRRTSVAVSAVGTSIVLPVRSPWNSALAPSALTMDCPLSRLASVNS